MVGEWSTSHYGKGRMTILLRKTLTMDQDLPAAKPVCECHFPWLQPSAMAASVWCPSLWWHGEWDECISKCTGLVPSKQGSLAARLPASSPAATATTWLSCTCTCTCTGSSNCTRNRTRTLALNCAATTIADTTSIPADSGSGGPDGLLHVQLQLYPC